MFWGVTSMLGVTQIRYSSAVKIVHCSPAINIAELRLYALQNPGGIYSCPTFVPAACLPSTLLIHVHTHCTSAIYIADLLSIALQNLVGIHHYPTYIRSTRLPPTSPTSLRTHCRISLLCTSILHSKILHVYRHYHCPTFVDAARLPPLSLTYVQRIREPRLYVPIPYIHIDCSPTVNLAGLYSYVLQNLVGTYCCQTFLCTSCLALFLLATFICAAPLPSTLLISICTHSRTALHAPLSFIHMCCSSAVITADLRSYALQNHVATHFYPTFVHSQHLPPFMLATFVHPAYLPSTLLISIRTRGRTAPLCTWVLHLYLLLICSPHR